VNRTDLSPYRSAEALQDRFARHVASHLEALAYRASPDVEERLRFSRELALARARQASRPATPARTVGAGLLALGGGSWWLRLASIVPLIMLISGLTLIQERHWNAQIEAAADIDAALLTDDLPPVAYADPGFAAYLNSGIE
jgi:Protein of unknown function (DUF3619)